MLKHLLHLFLVIIPVVHGASKAEKAQKSYRETSWKEESEEYYSELVNFAFATGKNDSFFSETSDGKFQIKDIYKSIKFDGMEYSFQVEKFQDEAFNCKYQFGKNDTNFQKVILDNGKKVSSIYFVCTYMRTCSGLECKWNWALPILASLILSPIAAVCLLYVIKSLLHRIFPFCY